MTEDVFERTFNWYSPLRPVSVPAETPFNWTDTPFIGLPSSLVTRPLIRFEMFCAAVFSCAFSFCVTDKEAVDKTTIDTNSCLEKPFIDLRQAIEPLIALI